MTLKPLAIFLLMLSPIAAFPQDRTCSPATVAVQSQQPQNENPIKIRKVIFTGYTVLSPAEQEEISAALSKGSYYKSKEEVPSALSDEVRRQWQQRGYFKVEAGEPNIVPDENDPFTLTATVWIDAGKQYRLGGLRFVKNTVFSTEKLRSLLSMQSGEIFDTWQVGKGMEEIRKLYGVQGYINISIIPTTQIEKGSDRVVLTLEMDEGPQFRVGKVEVLGADEAKSRQFVSQSGLITGSIYDSSRLQKAFVSESDGFEAMEDSVMRTINEADSTVDFKVDLRSCASVSHR